MRHGNALNAASDKGRSLSPLGRREAKVAGEFLYSFGEIPNVILHSPLLRSKQTGLVVEKEVYGGKILRLYQGIEPEDSPQRFMDNLLNDFAEEIGTDFKVMVVSHEPFISSLASLILWNSRCDISFDTGTLLGAESDNPKNGWRLNFYINAEQLMRII
jgi:phosphohistidine phosphatase